MDVEVGHSLLGPHHGPTTRRAAGKRQSLRGHDGAAASSFFPPWFHNRGVGMHKESGTKSDGRSIDPDTRNAKGRRTAGVWVIDWRPWEGLNRAMKRRGQGTDARSFMGMPAPHPVPIRSDQGIGHDIDHHRDRNSETHERRCAKPKPLNDHTKMCGCRRLHQHPSIT